jgi:hypothetical protein
VTTRNEVLFLLLLFILQFHLLVRKKIVRLTSVYGELCVCDDSETLE